MNTRTVKQLATIMLHIPVGFFLAALVAEQWLSATDSLSDSESELGLWKICDDLNGERCYDIASDCSTDDVDHLNTAIPDCGMWRAVRGFAILAVLSSAAALISAFKVLLDRQRTVAATFTCFASLFASICGMLAMAIFAKHRQLHFSDDNVTGYQYSYSYSFILVIIGWILCLLATVIYWYLSRPNLYFALPGTQDSLIAEEKPLKGEAPSSSYA